MRQGPTVLSPFWDGYDRHVNGTVQCQSICSGKVVRCKSGRAKGKKQGGTKANVELEKLCVAIHSAYKDLKLKSDNVLAVDVKNSFQGIASEQDTLIKHYEYLNDKFYQKSVSAVPLIPTNGIAWL